MEQISVEEAEETAPDPVHQAGLALDGEPGMITAARHFTADFLAQLPAGEPVISARLSGTAALVVSELVTNSFKYAPGPCLLDLRLDGTILEITVWDAEAALPLARAPEPGRVGQHGLEIVLALCEGYEVQREAVGKRTRVRIRI